MSRVERIGDATLYLGECMDILPTLEKVDVTITDPPYSKRTHDKARTNKKETARSNYAQGASRFIDFACLSDEEFTAMARACLNLSRRWVVMTCDHRHAALTFDWKEHIRLGAWVKVGPMPQVSGDRPGSGHESVLILHNPGRPRWNRGGGAGIWVEPPCKGGTEVATQKPLPLIKRLVADFTDQGEVVCDPFLGSGTTGVACVALGRGFIGIERDPERFEIAVARIREAYAHRPLFAAEPKRKPEQGSFLEAA